MLPPHPPPPKRATQHHTQVYLQIRFAGLPVHLVEVLKQHPPQCVLARLLIVGGQVVLDGGPMVAVQLLDDAFHHLPHLPGVVVEGHGAEAHHVVQSEAAETEAV